MGPHVVAGLLGRGHDITLLNRGRSSANLPDGVNQIVGDRDNIGKYAEAIKQVGPDVVVDMILLNQRQTVELLDIISGLTDRLVVISSGDVYRRYNLLRGTESGPVEDFPLDEAAALREKRYPYRDYASGPDDRLYDYDKILVEQQVMNHPGIKAAVLRMPFIYGPMDYQHRLFEYLKRMDDNRPAIILGNNQARARMTRGYVANCSEAIIAAVCNPRATGQIFNVGDKKTLTEREWVSKIAEATGWKGKIISVSDQILPRHLHQDLFWEYPLNMDTSRIREELDFTEKVTLEDSIKDTVDWERDNPPEKFDPEGFDYEAEDKLLYES